MVQLHCHTISSAVDSLCKPKDLANAAREQGVTAVACTDHGVLAGLVQFQQWCTMEGLPKHERRDVDPIKPLLGCELYVAPAPILTVIGKDNPNTAQDTGHITVLARNAEGYRNLVKLSTISYTHYVYKGRPKVDMEHLIAHREGLIVLTGCMFGYFNMWLLRHHYLQRTSNDIKRVIENGVYEYEDPRAELVPQWSKWSEMTAENVGYDGSYPQRVADMYYKIKEIFQDDLYIEMQNHGTYGQQLIREFWDQIEGQKVAANDVHYITKDQAVAQNFLTRTRANRDYEAHKENILAETYFKTEEEMLAMDLKPEWLELTNEVADRINYRLCQDPTLFPSVEIPEELKAQCATIKDYLRYLCKEGIGKELYIAACEKHSKEFLDKRIEYELDVIDDTGFPGYFVIVMDIMERCRQRGIQPGPGRGSVGSSMVAYFLKIHEVDAMEWNLMFERFLNPDRVTPPDIDIDFPKLKRNEVVSMVVDMFQTGKEDRVCGIGTAGKFSVRSCLQDAGRLLKIDKPIIDRRNRDLNPSLKTFAMIEDVSPSFIKETEKLLGNSKYKIPGATELVPLLKEIEGCVRNYGQHASGFVICGKPLEGNIPLMRTSMDHEPITQYTMDDLEWLGACKMDLLSVLHLDVQDDAFEAVGVDRTQIDYNDPEVWNLINTGRTVGMFQIGTPVYQRIIKDGYQCNNMTDLLVLLAIGRPGIKDLGLIETFMRRKSGNAEVTYLHSSLIPLLKRKYGILIFQEDIMRAAKICAGYNDRQADELRKFAGKKLTESMSEAEKEEAVAPIRKEFIAGCRASGIIPVERRVENENGEVVDKKIDPAEELFKQICAFGRYGFNEIHSLEYAIISYRSAWLKTHHPIVFLGACLRREDDQEEWLRIAAECRRQNIRILSPDINESDVQVTWDVENSRVRLGLSNIKGIGIPTGAAVVKARGEQPFTSLQDFVERVLSQTTGRTMDRQSLACLAWCHAFDTLVPEDLPPREYACSLLTSERLTAKQREKLQDTTPSGKVDLVKNKWLSLIRFGVNYDEDGLAKTYRKNRTRKKQTPLEEIVASWNASPPGEVDPSVAQPMESMLLGFHLTDHPVSKHEREASIADVEAAGSHSELTFTALVTASKVGKTKEGDTPFVSADVEDGHLSIRVALYNRDQEKVDKLLKQLKVSRVVHITGKMAPKGTYFKIKRIKNARLRETVSS